MPKQNKSHNFWIALNISNKKISEIKPLDEFSLNLLYKYGSLKKRANIGFKIAFKHWDRDSKKIITRYLNQYPEYEAIQTRIDDIKSRINGVKSKMQKGQITLSNAFIEILERKSDESVLEWYESYSKRVLTKVSTRNKVLRIINATQNYCKTEGKKEYEVLRFNHFADPHSIEILSSIIKSNPKLSSSTAHGYLKVLEQTAGKYDKNLKGCFTKNSLLPTYNDPMIEVTELSTLYQAIDKIKTLQDLEAFLFWLLSFCLRGLDGQDITRIRGEMITSEDEYSDAYDHYIPDYFEEGFEHKKVLTLNRKKWGKKMRILFNAYPTMHIFHNLKNLVKLNHKEYANKGKDPYAIYNFDVNTDKGQAKWDKLRRNYAGKLSNLIGKSFKNTRHTFVSFGEDLGVPDVKLSEILGHRSTKGSLRKYKKFSIQEIDLIHLQILDDSDIINLFHTLYNSLKDKKPFRGLRDTFFPKWFTLDTVEDQWMLHNKLLEWNYEDEWKLQKEFNKHYARLRIPKKDGVYYGTLDTKESYHDELKDLIRRKENKKKQRVERELKELIQAKKN